MSPSQKPRNPKKPKPSHARRRHAAPVEESAPVVEPPTPELARTLGDAMRLLTEACTAAGGILPRDLVSWIHAAAGTRPPVIAPPGEPSTPTLAEQWITLGVQLAARPHRLALAMRVAGAATSGGNISPQEEDALVKMFGDIIDAGIERSGGVTEHAFAAATWHVLHGGDWIRDARRCRPRCPAMAKVPCPDDPGFVDALRAAAPQYLRTVIAGATDEEISELTAMFTLGERVLDERYRPFAGPFTEDVYPNETHERALANMSRRFYSPEDMCSAVEDYAYALDLSKVEADMPPVTRIGLVVWLAVVALRPGAGQ